MRRKRGCRIGVVVFFGFPLMFGAVWWISEYTRRDGFAFLDGQSPVISGADRNHAHSGKPAYYRYRAYSWNTGFDTVVAKAQPELARLGYRGKVEPSDATWEASGYRWVMITPGHSRSHRDLFRSDRRSADRGWVTVLVGEDLEETLSVLVRSQFEPSDY